MLQRNELIAEDVVEAEIVITKWKGNGNGREICGDLLRCIFMVKAVIQQCLIQMEDIKNFGAPSGTILT